MNSKCVYDSNFKKYKKGNIFLNVSVLLPPTSLSHRQSLNFFICPFRVILRTNIYKQIWISFFFFYTSGGFMLLYFFFKLTWGTFLNIYTKVDEYTEPPCTHLHSPERRCPQKGIYILFYNICFWFVSVHFISEIFQKEFPRRIGEWQYVVWGTHLIWRL